MLPKAISLLHKAISFNKEQSTEKSRIQSTVQSNDSYIYGVGIATVLVIDVCVFFTYNKNAGQVIHEQPIKPKRRNML